MRHHLEARQGSQGEHEDGERRVRSSETDLRGRFYDDCEFEWVAIAGPGPLERVQFHRDAPTFQMITELNMRVRYMDVVNRV